MWMAFINDTAFFFRRYLIIFAISVLLLPNGVLAQGNTNSLVAAVESVFSSHVSVLGIPLGSEYKSFVKELKGQGFKVKAERVSEKDDAMYGRYHECFLLGEVAGNPTSIRLKMSCMTKTVFEAEVVLREFIDVEEAAEQVNRMIPNDVALYPVAIVENNTPDGNTLVEIVGKDKKVTSYLCLPWGRVFLRFYDDEAIVEKKDAVGLLNANVYELTMNHECIICMRYYDAAAAKQARAEAGHVSF